MVRKHVIMGQKWGEHSRQNRFTNPAFQKWEIVIWWECRQSQSLEKWGLKGRNTRPSNINLIRVTSSTYARQIRRGYRKRNCWGKLREKKQNNIGKKGKAKQLPQQWVSHCRLNVNWSIVGQPANLRNSIKMEKRSRWGHTPCVTVVFNWWAGLSYVQ